MKRCIVTYAAGAHEELLDVALSTYKVFAQRHGYTMIVGRQLTELPPAWNKIPLLQEALSAYDEVVWFDCDLIVVDFSSDFPAMKPQAIHALVRHFEDHSEVPNSGVWRLKRCDDAITLLQRMTLLEVFHNHGWWEQAALMTLMGYTVPPEGSEFPKTKCRCVNATKWYHQCQFMRLAWNSHPEYRADKPRIIHCSYPQMRQRLEVMRELVKNPTFDYPKYEIEKKEGDN